MLTGKISFFYVILVNELGVNGAFAVDDVGDGVANSVDDSVVDAISNSCEPSSQHSKIA